MSRSDIQEVTCTPFYFDSASSEADGSTMVTRTGGNALLGVNLLLPALPHRGRQASFGVQSRGKRLILSQLG